MSLISSQLDRDFDHFLGHYLIEPGQYQHLDNQHVELTRDQLRVVVDDPVTGAHTYLYTVGRIRFIQDPTNNKARAQAVALTISNSAKIHQDGGTSATSHQMDQLLEDILAVRVPTTLYLVYNPESGYYALKNHNYATIAVLERISGAATN